jgi:hypothetical protein
MKEAIKAEQQKNTKQALKARRNGLVMQIQFYRTKAVGNEGPAIRGCSVANTPR